ncbi:ribonucleoside-diphosphate reductase, adenosylcobalamin-dependent [candidate division WWE3 bacterium RIFCSPLOWO2_01_FULL_39_13]|uniref:Vitamin B12-dependent ribonucleotide reductase n=1 Tax=candidate division WWE3 bacterium RIFCSPLOWO2_01_FULL_39_13 TaxID=1802624 RepID=A0A1F4V5H5_UNCKA|nr:MAG: ribonucleoside-diphosphate reductase, adenosylcobalamin-dependent [candidate division WWE3 bacterium RIFCSPLOWO2_01_FULL_39_13]
MEIKGNAYEIFMRRYALKGKDGKPRESLKESFLRVASHVAGAESGKRLIRKYTDLFFNLMADKRFIPNTPTWTGSKTKLGQLAACFVLPIKDDMGRERGGIFDTLKDSALIQQTGGGNGFSFSRLRPKGDRVSSSNGLASGPVSFLEAYDRAFGQIAQGGTRRGANMAVMRVDHPDIEEFIACKSEEGRIANFNISVGMTDKFMKAVDKNEDFDLINPRNGEVWKTVKARDIFDRIAEYAHKNGEPGVLFLDTANKYNPVPNQYELEATNPCGEQYLGPYENCCLGHVNINESVRGVVLDWDHLMDSVWLGTRFLDDVVTQNSYVPSVPELKESAHRNRRIGLGFMGLADAMYKLGIRYGSAESLDFSSQVTEFIRYQSMLASVELAKERGAFPGIKGSIYDPKNLKWEAPKPLVKHKGSYSRPDIDWNKIRDSVLAFGIRNSTQLTVAPTGTTSTVFEVEGYGCEPVFALAYSRNVYQAAGGEKNLKLDYISPTFQTALKKSDLGDEKKDLIIKEVLEKGTIQHMKDIPLSMKNTFVVSADIKPEEHIWMQAVIQRFVDNSISKTCNFPENASVEDVKKVYEIGWRLGCKGLTVYITGSRKEVVLETKETKEKKSDNPAGNGEVIEPVENEKAIDVKRPRPRVVVGRTHEISTPFGKAFITVNRNGETGRKPFEVFITLGKSGSDTSAMAEALGRLISGWLRSSSDPDKALEEIAYQLKGIGGSVSIGFGQDRIVSMPDAIAKVLMNELDLSRKLKDPESPLLEEGFDFTQESLFNHEEKSDDSSDETAMADVAYKNASMCPECNNMTLIETEGCVKCRGCGYSRC